MTTSFAVEESRSSKSQHLRPGQPATENGLCLFNSWNVRGTHSSCAAFQGSFRSPGPT